MLLAVDPAALRHLAAGRPTALVSGTNGKTTTTRLLAAALGTAGPVVSNARGANMPAGLASALTDGDPGARAALEVDEAWLPAVAAAIHPEVVALLNLSRDQLDRNNEVRMLARSWREAVVTLTGTLVVANADDPLTAWAARPAAQVTWVAAGQPWTADAAGCPNCGAQIAFPTDGGGWRCTACDLHRPDPDVVFTASELTLAGGRTLPLSLALPGRANRANAAMAVTAATPFGVDPERALAAIARTADVDGRYRSLDIDGVKTRLLLSKNPAGWLEVLDIVSDSSGPVVVGINARIADGRDPSWLWDVPFERLRGRLVIASGERSHDLAVRLHYADVEHRREPDLRRAIAAAGAPAVDLVANYTSFMGLTASLLDD
ncbi:MAG: hypothetical protein QOG64_1077 [Acidimicrobiaceae bacterium]|nr:hypothetical protein [Acidimicrobiaceae bacterium]